MRQRCADGPRMLSANRRRDRSLSAAPATAAEGDFAGSRGDSSSMTQMAKTTADPVRTATTPQPTSGILRSEEQLSRICHEGISSRRFGAEIEGEQPDRIGCDFAEHLKL